MFCIPLLILGIWATADTNLISWVLFQTILKLVHNFVKDIYFPELKYDLRQI